MPISSLGTLVPPAPQPSDGSSVRGWSTPPSAHQHGHLTRRRIPALTESRLQWVEENYVRADTITAANARLVDHQRQIPLVAHWCTDAGRRRRQDGSISHRKAQVESRRPLELYPEEQ